jgi:FSR family fosmidomycin resistance protein-like MFS transporter
MIMRAMSAPPQEVGAGGLDRRGMAVLSAGHASVDACQGAVPALLPFLIDKHDLTVAAATLLVLAATLGSTVIQPVLGA